MKLALAFLLATVTTAIVRTAGAQPRRPDPTLTYAVPVDGFPTDGPTDAKVTMVVVHDYTDPYSDRNRTTLDELRKKYGNDLRIVFRNVVVHPTTAMAGALASCAAHKQRKFDQMEDKLWQGFQQRRWDQSEVDQGNGPVKCWDLPEGCQHVVGYAQDIGLKVDRFKADMRACAPIITADQQEMQNTFAINATPSFFINGRYLSGAMPTASYETIIDEEMIKASDRVKKGTAKGRYYKTWVIEKGVQRVDVAQVPPRAPRPGEPDPANTYAVRADGFPSRGPADAKVTIVVFFDYASPFAERHRTVETDLRKKYGNDLRIVYRTMLVHPAIAMAGALAMCAADKQKKFDAMDNAIWDRGFKNRTFDQTDVDLGNGPQKCWDTPDGCTNVVSYATDLGLSVAKFKSDMKSCVQPVAADGIEASTFGVTGTPGFFINGRHISGAQPIEVFAKLVDEELAIANDRIKKGTPKARYYKTWVVDKGEKQVPRANSP